MLINCVAYQQGKKLKDIAVTDISGYIDRKDCFVWVALCDPEPAELDTMQTEFGLHPLALEDASHSHQRPKIEEYGDTVFAAMHLLERREAEVRVGELDVFIGSNFVLSVRSRSSLSFSSVRKRCEREPELLRHGAGFVLYALMDAVVDGYFPLLDALETELETIEDQIFVTGAGQANIKRLYELKRSVLPLKHAVEPLMEAAAKLYSARAPRVCSGATEYYRDVYDHLIRLNAAIDSIRDTIGTAIQANLSMVAIEDSEVTKRLAAWASIFAVATALAGIWGMNFNRMPELQWRFGYPLAVGIITVASVLLYRRFKRLGWL